MITREHEEIEEKLRELQVQDEKARTKHDKLMAPVKVIEEELNKIAAEEVALLSQLTEIKKKHANGAGRRKEA